MHIRYPILFLAIWLASCQAPVEQTVVPDSSPAVADAVLEAAPEQSDVERQAWEVAFERQRVIGDLLYDALRALDEDRLLTPAGDNAYLRYQRVLALDPDNQLAREGLGNIVSRYVELAAQASHQGRFPAAQTLLDRARIVDRESLLIGQAQTELERELQSGDLVFELDEAALAVRAESLKARLADMAALAREHGALVWITAPDDEAGRWIFVAMRESIADYRLRGNIELGPYAIVRLRMPEDRQDSLSVTAGEPDR